jgi:flagellar biosynthetic protein FliR
MTLRADIGWLFASLLLSVRVAAATILAPVLGPTQVPPSARVIIAVSLAAFIASALPPATAVAVPNVASLGAAAVVELIIGASLSLGFLVAYAATQFAGRALDIQMGFSIASVFDPQTNSFGPLLGALFGMAAVAVFLALDGHHVLIQALALSARTVPPGSVHYAPDWAALMEHSGAMFLFGAALAAPVMFALLLADISMAVMARSMPLLNVFVLSFAVKIVLGLIGLAASIRFAQPLLEALFSSTYQYWERAAGAH